MSTYRKKVEAQMKLLIPAARVNILVPAAKVLAPRFNSPAIKDLALRFSSRLDPQAFREDEGSPNGSPSASTHSDHSNLEPVPFKIEDQIEENKEDPIVILRECVDGVQTAIEEGHYELAVECIKTFYKDFFCKIEEVEDVYIELLEAVEGKLKNVIKAKNETAIKESRLQDIARFSSLYAGLGMKEEGFKLFNSHYLIELINFESIRILELLAGYLAKKKEAAMIDPELVDEKEPDPNDELLLDFQEAIRALFEYIASLIDEKIPYVEKTFGKENAQTSLQNLLTQTDVHSTKIYETFMEDVQLQDLVVKVNMQRMQSSFEDEANQEDLPEQIEPRQLTELLDQMALFSQYNELFDKFLQGKIEELSLKILQPEYKRHRYIKEIMTYYNILEEFFMMESAKKAILLDKLEDGAKTSSVVDNTFYVLKQSTHRALSTTNVNSACTIINMVGNILNLDYKQILETMLQNAIQGVEVTRPLMVLNNIEVSSEYTTKLKQDLETRCDQIFAQASVKDREKVKTCLAELTSCTKVFKDQILMKCLERVCRNRLEERVVQIMDTEGLERANYLLDETKYEENEVNDPWVYQFTSSISAVLQPYKNGFTENNYFYFVQTMLEHLAKELEKRILRKKFTQLGSVQLDKELKSLTDFFQKDTQRSVRDKFSRLTQISSLLNLMQVSDVADIWGEKANIDFKWKLNAEEVKAVFARRQDFKQEDIDRQFQLKIEVFAVT